MKKYIGKHFGISATALVCIFYIVAAIDFPLHDFANYYFGGYFLSHGNFTPNVYFPYEFNSKIATLGHNVFGNYAPNTPFLAMLFLPFSFLKPIVAKCIFNTISTFLFLWSLQRLVAFYKIKRTFMALLPLLFFIPIKNNLLF